MTRPAYTPGRKRPRPQRDRLLDDLRAAGLRGLTQAELLRPPDGEPIARAASRVHELRLLGHRIESRGRRGGQSVYVLVRDRQAQPPARTLAPVSPSQPEPALFERPAGPSAVDPSSTRLPLDSRSEEEER